MMTYNKYINFNIELYVNYNNFYLLMQSFNSDSFIGTFFFFLILIFLIMSCIEYYFLYNQKTA